MRLRIVNLESGGQQLPVTKKNLSRKSFNLEKYSFFIENTKNICFYPNRSMLNSYAFASSRIKIKNLDSIIRKKSLHTVYSQKKK